MAVHLADNLVGASVVWRVVSMVEKWAALTAEMMAVRKECW